MATLLLRFLPHGLVVLAVIGAIWWIDHQAAERTRDQIETAAIKQENKLRDDLRGAEGRLSFQLRTIDQNRADSIARLASLHSTVFQPTIQKELTREVRFTDPSAGLSDGLRASLNAALTAVSCTRRADGGIDCTLPGPAGDPEQ
jgi:hypothetical protein